MRRTNALLRTNRLLVPRLPAKPQMSDVPPVHSRFRGLTFQWTSASVTRSLDRASLDYQYATICTLILAYQLSSMHNSRHMTNAPLNNNRLIVIDAVVRMHSGAKKQP